MPPTKIPKPIIITSSGNNPGQGPESIIEIKKKNTPTDTILAKFFFSSLTILSEKEVIVYVIVSIEKTIPINQTGRFAFFSLIYNKGSLKVKHISEVDIQRADAKI